MGAKKSKGYRASIYKCAEHCVAYRLPEEGAIYYEVGSSDLLIKLIFASRNDAALFQNELLKFSCIHTHFQEKLKLEEQIIEKEITDVPQRVFFHHYIPKENEESPEMSLNDVLSTSISVSQVTIGNSIAYTLQAVEEENMVRQYDSKWYKCHLISAKDKKYEKNPDNIIYASHTFHQLLDGINTSEGVGVVIKFSELGDKGEVLVDDNKREVRQKVIVFIEFRDKDIATSFAPLLKNGSIRIDDYRYQSFLYARNGETMKYCLETKYSLSYWEDSTSVSDA